MKIIIFGIICYNIALEKNVDDEKLKNIYVR